MISLVKFYSFACLICFQTVNLASARLAPNEKFSLESVAISDAIRDRSTSPPSLVSIGTLCGGATGDLFGYSVSLSYNGYSLVVGSPFHEGGELSEVGLAQEFNRQNSSQWVEAWNATGGNEYDGFGYSTSLSGNGMQLTVGTLNEYAKLVETKTGKEISILGDDSDWYFGQSVSVSHDGNCTAVAGDDVVQVFGKEDGSIHQIGEDILTDSLSTVALSADGDILAVGEYLYDNYKGRVRVFEWSSSEWKQLGGDMVGGNENDLFGYSLDITADGNRVIIGTKGGNYAKVYDNDGSDWGLVGGILSGESNDDSLFGNSVSISDNGSRIVIGSPDFTSDGFGWRGRAIVYQFESGAWNQLGDDILGNNTGDVAGSSVAISGDGNIISIGAPWADSNRGNVMIYEVN